MLLDIDDTLVHGDDPIDGAAAALQRLRERSLPFRLLTNTTRRSQAEIRDALHRMAIAVEKTEVLCPAVLAAGMIRHSRATRTALFVADGTREDFAGLEVTEDDPDWIVFGDLGDGFTPQVLNRAFALLQGGARWLALQKNPCWHDPQRGVSLDAGAYVAALEYATDRTAEIVGKPSAPFFEMALADLGLPAESVLMVGDDVVNDVGGAAAVGCLTVLVKTGKFREDELRDAPTPPDLILDSIAGLR